MNGTSKELIGVYANGTPISSIYHGLKLVWSKKEDEPINELIFEVDIKSSQFYIPIEPSGSQDMVGVVDWGDGKTEEVTMNGYPNYTKYHIYSKLGTYTVKFSLISGEYNINDNRFSDNNNRITKIISYGNQLITKFLMNKTNKINSLPKNYPFKDGVFKLAKDEYDGVVNFDGLFAASTLVGEISNSNITRIEGDMFKDNDAIVGVYGSGIKDNSNLEYIESLYLPNVLSASAIMSGNSSLHTVKKVAIPTNHSSFDMGLVIFGAGNSPALREMTVTNIGDYKSSTIIKFDKLTNWGVDSTKVPNAKQSLVDSLITNTPDKSAESKALSIYLSANTKAALTDEEKAQITSKGYTIA